MMKLNKQPTVFLTRKADIWMSHFLAFYNLNVTMKTHLNHF